MEPDQRPTQASREWRERASSTSTSPASQRRRTSTAHVRPAGPPPNLPMPSLPPSVSSPTSEHFSSQYSYFDLNSPTEHAPPAPYHRAAPSPNLTALANFSHSRHQMQQQQQQQQPASASEENLSDSPPRSFLHPPPSRPTQSRQDRDQQSPSSVAPTQNGTNLLAPPDAHAGSSSARRPSPRRTLTRALELAREAVTLDAMNDDPHAAVLAYGKSVALLSEVMERVRRGEESTERRGSNGRRRSIVAQEEEIRRLKSIHDTYADRMNILSLIYHIPPQPHNENYYSTSSTHRENYYSTSATPSASSTQPPSPTSSASPVSDANHHNHYHQPQHSPRSDAFYIDNPLSMTSSDAQQPLDDGAEEIGVAMFELQQNAGIDTNTPSPKSNYHPFSAQYAESSKPQPVPSQPPTPSNRTSFIGTRRARASSILPPPPPPPSSSPPPPPVSGVVDPVPELPPRTHAVTRSRGNSITGHHRGNSGSRLEALREESEVSPPPLTNGYHENDTTRNVNRDSHPLPPLPVQSPTTSEGATPRSDGPPSSSGHTPRKRVSSIRQPAELPHLINHSTNMGTISQRRLKSSAPPTAPSTRPASPAGSEDSLGSVGSLVKTPTFIQNTTAGSRTRAASQPGRRPSIVAAGFQHDAHPPPATAGPTTSSSQSATQLVRASSYRTTKSPPPLPPLMANFEYMGNMVANGGGIVSGNAPMTPISPLPPSPPTDPLLKPYHLMVLLRLTMTSQSGGYITRRLHVPQEVWSQGGAKLLNLSEKIKVVSIISTSLEDLALASSEYFGAGNVGAGLAMGIGSITKKEGEAWVAKLDEFSTMCENVVSNFGKKLGVGEGFVSRKTTGVMSWGKLSRGLDKLTNGKNLDSPAVYVAGLKQLFQQAQLLDEHTKAAFTSAASYTALPTDVRNQAEMRLKRSSDFFATVVLTFVIRDLSQLLDKYAKKCEKWLAE